MTPASSLNRRQFLKQSTLATAVAAAPLILP
jgi:hypothetical protein